MREVVLFHTHGLGPFDFSNICDGDLSAINDLAERRSAYLCPTIYLKEARLKAFEEMIAAYARALSEVGLSRFLGFAIEGPMLGRKGGIPRGSVWRPSVRQWHSIASWFARGLKYIVLAPDQYDLDDNIDDGFTFADLLSLIYDAGGRIAFGHFCRSSPGTSARRIVDVLDYLESRYAGSPYLVLTDHLLNDMPRNFLHAFRTLDQLEFRDAELKRVLSQKWTSSSLPDLLGPVPAALLNAAESGRITPALNFDGAHVDLIICQKLVDHLGSSRLIAMTDSTEIGELASEPLRLGTDGRLFYRNDGVLAASAVPHEEQIKNMVSMQLDNESINNMFFDTPLAALTYVPRRHPRTRLP